MKICRNQGAVTAAQLSERAKNYGTVCFKEVGWMECEGNLRQLFFFFKPGTHKVPVPMEGAEPGHPLVPYQQKVS